MPAPQPPAPSLDRPLELRFATPADGVTLGRLVGPSTLPADAAALKAHGFEAAAGTAIRLWSGSGAATVAGGVGAEPTLASVRDAAAAIARTADADLNRLRALDLQVRVADVEGLGGLVNAT